MNASPRRSREIDQGRSCDRRRRLMEELLDGSAGRKMRRGNAGDGKLAEDRAATRAVSLVEVERRADDHGLRRDRRLTKRARGPDPGAIEGWRDQKARRPSPEARERLDKSLLERARTAGMHLGQVLHELA